MNKKSRQYNIKLIENVRKHPCLYQDITKEQQKAWKSISEQLSTPDHLVQDLWQGLRTQYAYSVKKKKKFDLDEYMGFLRPHLVEIEAKASDVYECSDASSSHDPDVVEVIDLASDDECNNGIDQVSNSMPKKRKINEIQHGAQYFANPVLDDRAGSLQGPQIERIVNMLSLLTEEQLKEIRCRMFAPINGITDDLSRMDVDR